MVDKKWVKRYHFGMSILWFVQIPVAAYFYRTMGFEQFSKPALLYTIILSQITLGVEHLVRRAAE